MPFAHTHRVFALGSALLGLSLFAFPPSLLADVAAGPQELRLELTADHEGSSPLLATLRAEPLEEGAADQQQTVTLPWQGQLRLDPRWGWRITLEAIGYWAPAASVPPGGEHNELALHLWPAATVSGLLEPPPGEPLPVEVTLQLESTPTRASSSKRRIPRTTALCPVAEGRWECTVPATRLDLRLAADGFVPLYLWDVDVPAEPLEVGVWQLERGGSLAGWITWSEASEPEAVAVVVLDRQLSGWQGDPAQRQRLAAQARRATANERGFFQLKGIPAGGYVLTAEKTGFAPARIFDLEVETGAETMLEEPIVLRPPPVLELTLQPPTPPGDQPWLIKLSQLEPGSSVLIERAGPEAAHDGEWRHVAAEAGQFLLEVIDAHGSVWAERWLRLEPGLEPLFLEIPLVPIVGRITLGDEPLSATLAFGSTQRRPQVRVRSGEDGRFEGYLPREGEWLIDLVFEDVHQAIAPVEVRKRPGKRAAVLDIALPDTHLEGEVVAAGEPVPGALLAIFRTGENKGRAAILSADEEGRFALRGLEPGILRVHAYHGNASSPWVRVDLQEDLEPGLVRLELQEKIVLSGLVLAPAGEVPGASVSAWPVIADRSFAVLQQTVSGYDGSFTLELPHGATAADLIVAAPGFATALVRVVLSPDEPARAMVQVEPAGGALVVEDPSILGAADEDGKRTIAPSAAMLRFNGTEIAVDFLVRIFVIRGRILLRSGGVALADMPPGEYELCADTGCDAGFLPPHGELSLRVGQAPGEDSQGKPRQ